MKPKKRYTIGCDGQSGMGNVNCIYLDHVNRRQIGCLFGKITLDQALIYEGLPCWIWQGEKDKDGYGRAQLKGIPTRGVHRIMYAWLVGPVPKASKAHNLVVHHKCERRACCNPAHLEIVTQQFNVLASNGITAHLAQKTHCPQGHEYTAENTQIRKNGARRCRACAREYQRKKWREQPELMRERSNANCARYYRENSEFRRKRIEYVKKWKAKKKVFVGS